MFRERSVKKDSLEEIFLNAKRDFDRLCKKHDLDPEDPEVIKQHFEFGGEVEAAFVEGTVVEPNGALVAVAEGVAEDAVEGGEAGSGAGEEDGLVGVAGGVEAVAGGALEGDLGAGCGVGEPVAHGSAGDAADVEFEGLAGDGVAAGEAVFTEQGEVLARAMVEGFGGGKVDLEDGFAEPVALGDERGDAGSGAGGGEIEVGFWAAEAG